MRYAGVEILPEKKPAHVDSVVWDEADRAKVVNWFCHRPAAQAFSQNEPLLEVKNLTFGYEKKQKTLQDVTLTIRKGEMVSIVGKNGAGKSTFSKLVCGFETPDSGGNPFPGKRPASGKYPPPCKTHWICYAKSKPDDFQNHDF